MSHAPPLVSRPLPGWLIFLGSLVILFHLFALSLYVLAAPSGPWPAGMGVSMAEGPQFAVFINNKAPFSIAGKNVRLADYLGVLKMSNNYHFVSNRPSLPGVRAEIKLKNDRGDVIKTVLLPDPKANFWVQHRQSLLVRALADDQPVEPPGSEPIAGPGKPVAKVEIWDGTGEWSLVIRSVPQHLVPRDRPVMRPSNLSRLLARSYVRHLCRETGAVSGEVLRTTRDPIMPNLFGMEDFPPGTFGTLVSNFGEMSR